MFCGLAGIMQKRGSAEAASGGSKSVVIALHPTHIITRYAIFVKYIKNSIFTMNKKYR